MKMNFLKVEKKVVLKLMKMMKISILTILMIEIRDSDLRKQDCRCSDFAFGRCAEGVAGDKIHVSDLQECIFQCDVSRGLDNWTLSQ